MGRTPGSKKGVPILSRKRTRERRKEEGPNLISTYPTGR